ncbi:MAG: tyrosine-protein phosphatase [Acidobacteria bacterium]|nr:tyrosine-protein phosphatase [Acidobacteriota bacterium]
MRGLYGLPNFRDPGGLTATDGCLLKTGVLFRSTELAKLSGGDRATLRARGIKLICDMRSSERSRRRAADLAPDHGMRIVNVPVLDSPEWEPDLRKIFHFLLRRDGMERFDAFNRDFYHHFAFDQSARVGEVLRLLADDSQGPALFH